MKSILPINIQLYDFVSGGIDSLNAKKLHAIYDSCVEQTKSFLDSCGFSDVVIGISGGIDSALVAKVAVDALGKERVHGVILPGPYTSKESLNDAYSVCSNLDINSHEVSINSSYKNVVSDLQASILLSKDDKLKDLTLQNIQARLRMLILMSFSNELGYLLLNTANKSEVFTGYSTLYGDMAGMYAPIGNIYKTDVFKICLLINMLYQNHSKTKKCIIPASIIAKPPSAELTSSQTDESSLGIDYASLDTVLYELIDMSSDIDTLISQGFDEDLVRKVDSLVKKSEFKRRYEPPSPVLK